MAEWQRQNPDPSRSVQEEEPAEEEEPSVQTARLLRNLRFMEEWEKKHSQPADAALTTLIREDETYVPVSRKRRSRPHP